MPDEIEHSAQPDEPFLEINTDNEEGGGKPTLIFVITIVLIILLCGFFVFYKYRTDAQVTDKQQSLNNVLDQLHSSDNKSIETKADNVNSVIKIITSASKSKYSFNGFITELSKKITNDTKLNSLSISDIGLVSMDGSSSSYRSVADLAVALGSSTKLENVQITSLTRGSTPGNNQVNFSMTAQIKDWKSTSSSGNSSDLTPSVGGSL